ncbi:kinase-like domain, phloem protein 2-like protein [Tanacetum coccineum]|uniref:Kinase-like domain, phloem protein 2-like protein n=1 Tax=Tanacetum coccineum TaxID=301880 RepID=A0ABQ5B9A9_9ASTR
MAFFLTEFKNLKIQLEDIRLATNNFDESKVIGGGGFGKVYEGELSHSQSEEKSLVAIKRLDRRYGQGDPEFFKEIRMLSCYRHENLISLLGFCNQEGEMVLITSHSSGEVSNACTPGYCDPLYMETYSLTKESDVYSFGVVLFEVMCGRLCVENSNGRLNVYVPSWRKSYEENKLNEIILQDLIQQMNPSSLKTFSDIAFRCLRKAREERPTMSRVVEELEIALESQEFPDLRLELLTRYEEILKAVDPLQTYVYKTGNQLKELLSKGLVVYGKTCLFINEKGHNIERIYIQSCLDPVEIKASDLQPPSVDIVNSRFPRGLCYEYYRQSKAQVRAEYLSPHISYTVNLVFRYKYQSRFKEGEALSYRLVGEDEIRVFIVYPSYMREDGWFIAPLYQFTSQHKTADLQFEFQFPHTSLIFAGIEFQPYEEKVELQQYQDIVEVATQSLFYTSLDELKQILSKGVYINGYKTWFSLNEKGEHCHMISMKDCLIPNEDFPSQYKSNRWSRFPAGFYQTNNKGFKTHVKTQLLSPSITYTVNLVFHAPVYVHQVYVNPKYRFRGETTTYTVYLAKRIGDEMMHMAELCQFTSHGRTSDLEIIFDDPGTNVVEVEGILFLPLPVEIVEDQGSKDDKVENFQTISDSESDTYWEQMFPNDYEEILNLSKDSPMWTTKKELYSILIRGFLINNGQEWFTVDKHGKKCPMLSSRATWVTERIGSRPWTQQRVARATWESSHESRFGEVLVITAGDKFELVNDIKPEVLSADTKYASYFVFKLPSDQSKFEFSLAMRNERFEFDNYGMTKNKSSYIYLVSPPNTPVIGQKFDENSYNPLNRHKQCYFPRQRGDGWMEVKAWEFETRSTPTTVSMHIHLERLVEKNLSGLIIHGIELRPI